jgi:AcrR family transcriptional regulator
VAQIGSPCQRDARLARRANFPQMSGDRRDAMTGEQTGTTVYGRPARTAATRDPESTKAAILAASLKEFTEKGFGGARIDAIAAHANINKRMLYHYYGGKEALYVAVLEYSYGGIRAAETDLDLGHRDPKEAIRALVLFTWHYYLDHPEFLSLLGTENLMRGKYLKRSNRVVAMNSPLISGLADVLQRGVKLGEFRPGIDALDVYLSIAGLGFFYLSNRWTLSTVFRRELMDKGEVERWGEHIVEVILKYLSA